MVIGWDPVRGIGLDLKIEHEYLGQKNLIGKHSK